MAQMTNTVSDKDFHMLAEVIPQLIWIITPEGEFLYCNKQFLEYLNISSKTKNIFEIWLKSLHPDDQEKTIQMWGHSVLTGKQYETEYRMKNGKTGEYRWFLARAAVMNDEDSGVRWFGTCTDIHEQKMIGEGQSFLAGSSKILASSMNYEENIQKVANLAVAEIADWCTVELIENNELKQIAVAHNDPQKVKDAQEFARNRSKDLSSRRVVPDVLRTGKSAFYPIITDDMLRKYCTSEREFKLFKKLNFESSMIVPISLEKKNFGVMQFVSTESKKRFSNFDLYVAEEIGRQIALSIQNAQLIEESQRKEKQFRALYNSNIIGVKYTLFDGKILEANDAFLNMLGYTKKDIEKGNIRWNKLSPPEYQVQIDDSLRQLKENGFVTPWERAYITRDGRTVPAIVCSVLLNKKTTETLTLVLDITERKKLEERKDEFIGITSHELKTPLTSIKGYVQILERITKDLGDEQMNLYIQKTNTYINKLNSLIVDLLDVSKVQAGKLILNYSTFDFQDLLAESIEGVQETTPSHKITVDNHNHFKWTADENRVGQVLINLLTNAIKYSPRSKKVTIHLENKKDQVVVGIQDYGIGISQNEISKIFERFYRVESVSKRFSGLGIGLYISYDIVKRHGGKMWVESELGKGSTFFFSLPRIQQK